jgi:hypothetical protein
MKLSRHTTDIWRKIAQYEGIPLWNRWGNGLLLRGILRLLTCRVVRVHLLAWNQLFQSGATDAHGGYGSDCLFR